MPPTARRPAAIRRARPRRRAARVVSSVAGLVLAVAVFAFGLMHQARSAAAGIGREGVAVESGSPLATANTTATGEPIDGISCLSAEQISYHIHIHLSVFVNGQPRQLPAGHRHRRPATCAAHPAGEFVDNGSCFYWLHTHAADGIIHVESPAARTFTLGDFFDVRRQPHSNRAVGVIDYAIMYCLAATVTPTARGQDALACLMVAVQHAQQQLGLADLRADRGEVDLIDETTGE